MRHLALVFIAFSLAGCGGDPSGPPLALTIEAPASVIGQLAMTPHGTLQRSCTIDFTATAAGGGRADYVAWRHASVRVMGANGEMASGEWPPEAVAEKWGGPRMASGENRAASWTPDHFAPYRVEMRFHYALNGRDDIVLAQVVEWRCP